MPAVGGSAPPNDAPLQPRAAQQTVRCNRLVGGMRRSAQCHPREMSGVDRHDHVARRHQDGTHTVTR
ncbi:MAG: hypothetical protein MUP13_14555 [Thermoanaerobaculales bacterium]|nr:hypothetical protein [Thermoanaerobaculales bacterium]